MAYKDLREFIDILDSRHDIKRIEGADWNLEIGGITEILARRPSSSPALLFDSIKSCRRGFRVLTNALESYGRTATALGIDNNCARPLDGLDEWRSRLRVMKPVAPRIVHESPIFECSAEGDEVDLFSFPVPKWHENDGGRYIGTGSLVVTKDPDTGWVNAGIYRVQVHTKSVVSVHFDHGGRHGAIMAKKYWDKGQNCPVSIVCGEDPALFFAGYEYLPWGSPEYEFAGAIKGEPIDVIEVPNTGNLVPAFSEIVLDGEMPPIENESVVEGPFGEYTGYYAAGQSISAIAKIKSIHYRGDPIIWGVPPIRSPYANVGLPLPAATLWNNLDKIGITDVVGVWQYSMSQITVVAVKQRYSGHAKRAGLVAAANSYMGRIIIVVDDDIDPSDIYDVLWAISTRCEPESSVDIIRNGWSSILDPRIPPTEKARGNVSNSKMIIDACKPFSWIKDFPSPTGLSPGLKKSLEEKWADILNERQ